MRNSVSNLYQGTNLINDIQNWSLINLQCSQEWTLLLLESKYKNIDANYKFSVSCSFIFIIDV